MDEIQRAKPSAAKGRYIHSVTLASTMGPGVRVVTDGAADSDQATTPAPAAKAPVVEEPAAEAPEVEAPAVEEPVAEETPVVEESSETAD